MSKLAVVRLRGRVGLRRDVKTTMEMLNIVRTHSCAVVDNNPSMAGMIKKVKDFVTFGEIDDDTLKLLVEKKAKPYKGRVKDSKGLIEYKSKYFEFNKKKYMPCFRLDPPKGGFERMGIKKSFKQGGSLGDRGKKINDLIKRMI